MELLRLLNRSNKEIFENLVVPHTERKKGGQQCGLSITVSVCLVGGVLVGFMVVL